MRLTTAQRRLARIISLAGVIVAGVLVLHLYPRSGADRIRHMIDWPGGCESVSTASVSMFVSADQQVSIQCQMLGPRVVYARFSSEAQRDRQLHLTPPSAQYCVAGTEIVIDGLDHGFAALCARLHGRVVADNNTD
jgi:hypothetical protein